MSIKTAVITITSIATLAANAGLYFVSGGDFRIPSVEYTIKTTSNNQTVAISPYEIRNLKY